jgi:hypothetical protein
MLQKMISFISIIVLLVGSLLLLAEGLGFVSSHNVIFAGVVCFIFSALIEVILKISR